MKKLLGITFLTALAIVATERPAQAWINSKFSIGLNWHYQSGGNCLFWGLWRNGQVPGPWGDGMYYGPINWPSCGFGGPYGGGAAYPDFGGAPAGDPSFHAGVPNPNAAPATTTVQNAGQGYQHTSGYQPGYYYPGYDYTGYYGNAGYYGVPSYWYGR